MILLATKLTTLLLLVMISIDTIVLRRLYDTAHPIKLTIRKNFDVGLLSPNFSVPFYNL